MNKPKTLRSTSAYRSLIERAGTFRVAHVLQNVTQAERVGFEAMPSEGEEILPAVCGPATHFNANGREVVRRDLPKESQSRMIWTSWKDWHGRTHTGMQTRDYEVYPRDLIPPPSEYLATARRGEELLLVSRELSRNLPEDEIVNVLNVFLELFGSLEIVGVDLAPAQEVRRVNWKILPPGSYPFARAREALEEYLARLPEGGRETANERIRAITRHEPDFLAVGLGGFSDYVVFGFSGSRRFVLESPNLGNATYIFRDDWESVSALTKREILQDNLQEVRLVHNGRWSVALHEALRRP